MTGIGEIVLAVLIVLATAGVVILTLIIRGDTNGRD